MTLHTGPGCSISNNGMFSGTITTPNCYVNAPGQSANAGCQITTTNTQSYGAGFSANGGGVYVTEWTSESINIYFFPRDNIPSDISSSSPDPSTWGTALASFSRCAIDSFFKDQQIVRLRHSPLALRTFILIQAFTRRSSTRHSAATTPEPCGRATRSAERKHRPASPLSKITLLPLQRRTGRSTLCRSTNRVAGLCQRQH